MGPVLPIIDQGNLLIESYQMYSSQPEVLNKNKNKLLNKDSDKRLSGQVHEQEARQGQCQELR